MLVLSFVIGPKCLFEPGCDCLKSLCFGLSHSLSVQKACLSLVVIVWSLSASGCACLELLCPARVQPSFSQRMVSG